MTARSAEPTSDIRPASAPQQAGIHPPPPQPEILSHLTIGLNSTTRFLELHAQNSTPDSLALHRNLLPDAGATATKSKISTEIQPGTLSEPTQKPLAAVFVSRSSESSLLHAHLPLLTVTASLSHPKRPSIVLVALPKGAEARLVGALGVPRVGVVGLSEGAPGSTALVEFVREKIKAVDVEWLHGRNKWRETEIKALKTTASGGKNGKDAGKVDKDRSMRTTKKKHKNRAGTIGGSE